MGKETPYLVVSPEVQKAIEEHNPLVALETAVITHGLPRPTNLQFAMNVEQEVRKQKAIPATIAFLDGKIRVGLAPDEIERLANEKTVCKISRRDYASAIARQRSGGTTVAGTLIAAHLAGLQVFATGGIGGVHRQAPFDVSADLQELAHTPIVVVCAGAKAILDLPATLEVLETLGVPVIGYQTSEFPAFYSRESGLAVNEQVDTPDDIARIARAHWSLGLGSAILVVVPPPIESARPREEIEGAVEQALADAQRDGIRGAAVTPYLLDRVSKLTGNASLQANLALLYNNARLAAQVAYSLAAT